MPTGYTAKLMEEGQSFPDFVMQCARAFGACVEMRDDPMDKPIPDKFEADDHHDKALVKSEAELTRLKLMTGAERDSFGLQALEEAFTQRREWAQKDADENARIAAVVESVSIWQPPSPNHVELKNFMLQQLATSRHRMEYHTEELHKLQVMRPVDFYNKAVEQAEWYVTYHKEQREEAIKRAEGRTDWVQQLRKSLEPYQKKVA